MTNFKISFLDHVAIKVRDLEISVSWYEKVLGLKKSSPPEWNNYPVLMLAGKSGVAIFKAKDGGEEGNKNPHAIRIDHFAFNVSNSDLENAKKYFNEISQEFHFQDHIYFQSVYLKDPDGHTVELTTLVTDESNIY